MLLGFGQEDLLQAYLAGSCALAVLLAAKCLLQIVFRKFFIPRKLEALAGLGALSLCFILAVDAFFLGNRGWIPNALLRGLVLCGSACLLLWAHYRLAILRPCHSPLFRQPAAWVAFAMTLAAAFWSSHRHHTEMLEREIERLNYVVDVGEILPIQGMIAVTDRGREVQLFHYLPASQDAALEPARPPSDSFFSRVWGSQDSRSNCHGWVFTGGQYLLWRDGVERILEDNGYRMCKSPSPGDLLIYRNEQGEPIHTGIVRSIGWDGTVTIESKWGLGSRFVHQLHEQPYGTNYAFYRSERKGHQVAFRATIAPSLAGSATNSRAARAPGIKHPFKPAAVPRS